MKKVEDFVSNTTYISMQAKQNFADKLKRTDMQNEGNSLLNPLEA